MNTQDIELRDLILKSEGTKIKKCIGKHPDCKLCQPELHVPITLDRILMALGKKKQQDFSGGINGDTLNIVYVDEETPKCGEEPKAQMVNWNLTKPLLEQTTEVKEKLIELLSQ